MKKTNFWTLTLCTLLLIAIATGWSLSLRVAVAANAVVVLIEVARDAVALYKTRRGDSNEPTARTSQS